MRSSIRYQSNPLWAYKVVRLGRLQTDEITGRPTYERDLATDDFGNRCDSRDPGSFDLDPKKR